MIAAVGSPEKIDVVKKYGGADHTVNYSTPGWQKEVLTITKGRGVDVVYDPVGLINGKCDAFGWFVSSLTVFGPDSLKCIAWKGRAVVVGFAGGTIEKVMNAKPVTQKWISDIFFLIDSDEPCVAQEYFISWRFLGSVYNQRTTARASGLEGFIVVSVSSNF